MIWLGAGTVFLVALLAALYGLASASRDKIGKALAIVVIILLAFLGVLLAITGKFFAALPILAMAAAAFTKLRALARLFGARASWQSRSSDDGNSGKSSNVKTDWLDMHLDHVTGDLDGTVLQGQFEGRNLASMTQDELMDLLDAFPQADDESTRLLEAYLDRVFGPDWRENEGASAGQSGSNEAPLGQDGKMTEAEALEILGLEPGVDADTVRKAHRDLMKKLHPDHGGNSYFAAKLNMAKEFLLSQYSHENTDR